MRPFRCIGEKKMANDGKGQERGTLPFKTVYQNNVTYPSIRLIWPLWMVDRILVAYSPGCTLIKRIPIFEVTYQTRGTVFRRNIQAPRRELKDDAAGFSLEAGCRTFHPVVFHSMSGTLISILGDFLLFHCHNLFYLSIS